MTESPEPTLYFVLGAPKSGTTWLQHALDRHPQLTCKGEGKFHYFRNRLAEAGTAYNRFIKTRNTQVFGRETFASLTIQDVDDLFGVFVERRLRAGDHKPGVIRIGSKDPDFGLYISEFAALFPRAPYLHIVRDPRDASVSMAHHMRRVHPEVNMGSWDDALNDSARGWRMYLEGVRAEVAVRDLAYLEVTYERMVGGPEETLSAAFNFLDVSADPAIVADCVKGSRFETLSQGRTPGQEDRTSFFRRGVAGGWRDELTSTQAARILDLAGPIAAELGYE